jgi:hypothetical protein
MGIHNLLSLPHLLAKQTKGRELLVDYSQSHVVTSKEYLVSLKTKAMDKATTNEAKETNRKQKKDVRLRKATNTLTPAK